MPAEREALTTYLMRVGEEVCHNYLHAQPIDHLELKTLKRQNHQVI